MATLRMTVKATDTETKTKQQIGPACSAEKAGFNPFEAVLRPLKLIYRSNFV